MARDSTPFAPGDSDIPSVVVKINRCAKVQKGGRRFSFSALVVAGDRRGKVGIGFGKANEVPGAVEKAEKDARKSLRPVVLLGETIPHPVTAKMGASKVLLMPAAPGTGIIAGTAVRAVVELAGVRNILTKAYGSTNPINLVQATMKAMEQLRSRQDMEAARGVALDPFPAEGWVAHTPRQKEREPA